MTRDPEQGWRWWAYVAGRCFANLPRAIRHPLPLVDTLINLERDAIWPAELRGGGSGSLTAAERLCLRWLCSAIAPRKIFEFGTGTGLTTRLLSEYARVWTLDQRHGLPRGRQRGITYLVGDSRICDLSSFHEHMDLIFIDGGHDASTVSSDSFAAERMRSPKGVIVWHDCNVQHRDVWRFLLARPHTRRVEGTRLAVDLGVYWSGLRP